MDASADVGHDSETSADFSMAECATSEIASGWVLESSKSLCSKDVEEIGPLDKHDEDISSKSLCSKDVEENRLPKKHDEGIEARLGEDSS